MKEQVNYTALSIFAWLLIPAFLYYLFLGQIGLCICLLVVGFLAVLLFRAPGGCAVVWAKDGICVAGCVALAIFLTMIGGEGRLFPATTDWIIRDAVLHDLVSRHWPFIYRLGVTDWMLRAPLGMYLIPAASGKILGLHAAYIVLWAQNSIALGTIIWILCRAATAKKTLVIIAVFCLFSGWDVVGALFISGLRELAFHTRVSLPADIGWWNGMLQYSSTMTLILWVPNHALAGWFFATLLILWERRQLRISALMMGTLLTALWSPFALMGALPFVAKAGLEALWQRRLDGWDIPIPVLLAAFTLPLIAYLHSDIGGVPERFLSHSDSHFFPVYVLFMAVEVAPFVVFNFIGRRHHGGFSTATYYLAVAVLFAIPFYKIGVGDDFVMRASIPSLAIMAITSGHIMFGTLTERHWRPISVAAIIFGLSSFTGFDQIFHVLTAPNRGISTCNFVQAWRQDIPGQINTSSMAPYLAAEDHVPAWLRPRDPEVYVTTPETSPCTGQTL